MNRRLRQRVEAWARRRQGADQTPLMLGARRIYILPTRAGLAFAVLLAVMLLAALNYNNSLGFLLTFLLAGLGLVSMYECHRQLLGLRLESVQVENAFARTQGTVELLLCSGRTREGRLIRVRVGEERAIAIALAGAEPLSLQLPYAARVRGRLALPRLGVESTAPLGLFRAWSWLYLPLQSLIYPAPRHQLPLPPPGAGERQTGATSPHSGEEEWAGLRLFRDGDSPRSVAWKLRARGAPLLVSQYEASAAAGRWLDLASLGLLLPLEQRLSQLTGWLIECERQEEPWGLVLGALRIERGLGTAHRDRALEALALYGNEAQEPTAH